MSCKVCNTSKYVTRHFGAAVCAACAAFFRRTVADAKVFRCLREQKCSVDQTVRNVCRACRFAKCLSVGMDAAEVEPRRDAPRELQKRRKTKIEVEDKSVIGLSVDVGIGASHQQTEIEALTTAPIHTDVDASHYCQPADQTIPWELERICAPKESDNHPGYLLDEVIELYHKFLDRRKFIHCDFTSAKSLFSNEQHISPQLKPASKETALQLKKREIALIADFMQSLRPLSHFSPDDKYKLFKHFAMEFFFVDAAYRTYLNNGHQTKSFILSTGEKIDLNKTELFFERFATKILDASTLKRLFHSSMIQGMRDVVVPMATMNMSEREMLALVLILLYMNHNAVELGFDQQCALKKAKDEVLGDLHAYYCFNNIADGEIRLGNVILLVPALLQWLRKKREQFTIQRFFNSPDLDESISDLF